MDLKERIELTRQTLDALERIEANGGNVPDGFNLEWSNYGKDWEPSVYANGRAYVMDSSLQYRLRSTTPRLVPLGPEDVPPGSVFRWACRPSGWFLVTGVTNEKVEFGSSLYDYAGLMSAGVQIKRPGEDWRPCSKPAP
jgi:hypothetical protein